MSTYSKKVTDLLANKDKLKKEALMFALIATGELKTPDEAKALIKSAENIVNRAGGEPRAMFYQYLLDGGKVTTREELVALQDRKNEDGTFYIPFSKDQKNKANQTHWLAIAKLVQAAFDKKAEELRAIDKWAEREYIESKSGNFE
jgi:hypothetical protein